MPYLCIRERWIQVLDLFPKMLQVSQSNYKSSPKDQPHTKTIHQNDTIYFEEEEEK